MKRLILTVALAACALCGRAQEPAGPQSEWLPAFTAVVVEGPVDVRLIRVPETEAPKVEYDTKGSYTTKFRAEVRERVLYIRERADSRRPSRTEVTLRYNGIDRVEASEASLRFADTIDIELFDLRLQNGARMEAAVDIQDLKADLSGASEATLRGDIRYLTLTIAGGRFDATEAYCMAASVVAQSKAQVLLDVDDRLEGSVATNASIRYKRQPALLRTATRFMAGAIAEIE